MIKQISKSERNEVVSTRVNKSKTIGNDVVPYPKPAPISVVVVDNWVACGALQRLFPALLLSFPFPANIGKKELLKSAPWRVEEEEDDKFEDAKLIVTNQPGSTPIMHVPGKKLSKSKNGVADDGDDSLTEMDPELRYSFQRNFQNLSTGAPVKTVRAAGKLCVFSMDTLVKPLPPAMGYYASRNLNFFTQIFSQFFDTEGIAAAQKSLGIGQEEKIRKVR